MNKYILISILFILTLSLSAKITLNEFGHITSSHIGSNAHFYYDKGEYFVEVDGKTLIGNSLLEVQNGYLTLTGEHENLPTWLRIYNRDGELLFYNELEKAINIKLSTKKNFAAYFDGHNLQVLDIEGKKIKTYQKSIQFTVDNLGNPLFVDQQNNLHYKKIIYPISENIRAVLFKNELAHIITKHSVFIIDSRLEKIKTFNDVIFEAKVIDRKLYFALKKDSSFSLCEFTDKRIESLESIEFDRNSNRNHEPIYAPLNYGEEDFPFPIGNSYAEIQTYGGDPYLHPGVDFLGDDHQEVYAVHDGFVKAVLSTGGDAYWRVAIANEDVATETEGYLYAHLNQNSITVNVGDEVLAGNLLGTLYPWNYFDFTHIHFARVFCTGAQWYGDWWTTENILFDVTNIQDTIPPFFENAMDDELFAFRAQNGEYLNPLDLTGEFDIIAKCYDQANHWYWKIDIHDLSYSLHSINDLNSILFEQFSYVYDFDLDTYLSGTADNMILHTIYSRDAACYSIGNYQDREYYHIITNSNGDSLITVDDAAEIFDSTQFPDNYYFFKVTARDACLNTTVDSMTVYFNNGNNQIDEVLQFADCGLTNYPNPFNPSTEIRFQISDINEIESTEIGIYNIKGQKVKELPVTLSGVEGTAVWNGKNNNNKPVSSGLYFYRLKTNNFEKTNKMILIK